MTDDSFTTILHQVTLGFGYDGYRAICSCGWRSIVSRTRDVAAKARDDHRSRTRLRSVL